MTHKGALIRIGSVVMMSGLLLTACSSSSQGGLAGQQHQLDVDRWCARRPP